jgi:hypothetical protein
MRWMLAIVMCCLCVGCFGSRGPQPGLQSPEGGWNAREKSVPGVKTFYGAQEKDDDGN